MTATVATKLHQTEKGQWVTCTASVRSCPRGNHVTVSGDSGAAAEFFNSVGVKGGGAVIAGSKAKSVKAIETVLRNTFKGVATAKRGELALRIWDELQYGAERPLTSRAYQEVYNNIAGAIAGVYERENTKGDPNSAARRIFLNNGWATTYVAPNGKPDWASNAGLRVVDDRVARRVDVAGQHLREGQILIMDNTRYEVLATRKLPNRMVARRVEEGPVIAAQLNPAYTDRSPHTTTPFWIDVDANKAYTLLEQGNGMQYDHLATD